MRSDEGSMRMPRIDVVHGLGPRASITVVVVRGDLDYASQDMLADALAPLTTDVLIDLSHCTFVDTAPIATILVKYSQLRASARWLELVVPAANRIVLGTVERLGLRHLLGVREDTYGLR